MSAGAGRRAFMAGLVGAWIAAALTSAVTGSHAASVSGKDQNANDANAKKADDKDDDDDDKDDGKDEELTPQQKMARRHPQPVRAGDLIGLPVLDFDDLTIGYVRQVVRKADDSIVLIVPYGGFLGLNKRPVAVPIETVVILARQLDALDFTRDDFKKAPAWMAAEGREIAASDMISIGLGRR